MESFKWQKANGRSCVRYTENVLLILQKCHDAGIFKRMCGDRGEWKWSGKWLCHTYLYFCHSIALSLHSVNVLIVWFGECFLRICKAPLCMRAEHIPRTSCVCASQSVCSAVYTIILPLWISAHTKGSTAMRICYGGIEFPANWNFQDNEKFNYNIIRMFACLPVCQPASHHCTLCYK